MAGKLVICPTPIGNLGDMPPRALEALKAADTVCAEDTRITGKLLAALGVAGKPLERLDENLLGARAAGIVQRVKAGETIAYCSDAGMPGVSDPGNRLVRAARQEGVPVEVLPGPTAVATAYVASGCISNTFYFGGFFPRKRAAQIALLEALKPLDSALIFYESPSRLVESLKSIADTTPYREVTVCRELTKFHEEVFTASAPETYKEFLARDSIKGEIVLVIGPPTTEERQDEATVQSANAAARATDLAAQGLRPKQIAKQLTEEFGIPRNEAYDLALQAKQASSDNPEASKGSKE